MLPNNDTKINIKEEATKSSRFDKGSIYFKDQSFFKEKDEAEYGQNRVWQMC